MYLTDLNTAPKTIATYRVLREVISKYMAIDSILFNNKSAGIVDGFCVHTPKALFEAIEAGGLMTDDIRDELMPYILGGKV